MCCVFFRFETINKQITSVSKRNTNMSNASMSNNKRARVEDENPAVASAPARPDWRRTVASEFLLAHLEMCDYVYEEWGNGGIESTEKIIASYTKALEALELYTCNWRMTNAALKQFREHLSKLRRRAEEGSVPLTDADYRETMELLKVTSKLTEFFQVPGLAGKPLDQHPLLRNKEDADDDA